jgi:hypothetical protein
MPGFKHTEQNIAVFQGVTAGVTAVANLPIGRAYHQLQLAAATLTDLELIRVFADNEIIYEADSAEIDSINQYDGKTAAGATTSLLQIDFGRHNLKSRALEELTSLKTGDKSVNPRLISALRVEVGIASGASSPTLTINGVVSNFDPMTANTSLKIMTPITLALTGATEHTFASFRKNASRSRALNRIIIKETYVTDLELRTQNRQIFERNTAENERYQNDGVRSPQAGYHVIDFTEDGHGDAFLRLSEDELRLLVTISADDTLTIWPEYIADHL